MVLGCLVTLSLCILSLPSFIDDAYVLVCIHIGKEGGREGGREGGGMEKRADEILFRTSVIIALTFKSLKYSL